MPDRRAARWKMVEMTSTQVKKYQHGRLQDAFAEAYRLAGAPADAAMFSRREGGRWRYYFSPEAARIAAPLLDLWRAVDVPPPQADGAKLMVGAPDAARLLDR